MPKLKIDNRFLYYFFPPWGKPEVSLTGAIAQVVCFVILIAVIVGYTSDYVNWKIAGVSAVYALLKNFV